MAENYEKLNQTLTEIGTAFETFKEVNDKRLQEIADFGTATAETLTSLSKVEEHIDEMQKRVSDIEAENKARATERHTDNERTQESVEHMAAFDGWLRAPRDPEANSRLKQAALSAQQASDPKMAVTITTTGGGNAIPTEVAARMQSKIFDLSPIRQISNVVTTSNENTRFVVMDNNSTGGWVAAGSSRTETVTPLFQAFTLTYGTAYAYPFVYEEAMNDLAMDVPGMIEDTAARVLAAQEGTAFVSGNGTARPTGFLNGSAVSPQTLVTTGDEASPQRAFGSVQYFPTGAAAAFQDDWAGGTASPVQDPAGVLFDTAYGIKAEYRAASRWVMNKGTLAAVRKFRDANGNYLYLPGLVVGQPSTLLGYPITEAEAMPDLGANAFPVAFGDFNSAYQIGDILATLRITVDDNITAPGWVKFYIRKRVGGNLANDDALKVIKCATS